MKPMVSIWMITYNHEKFISQAIESVLMQITNFDFEIIIGEDCSPDNTRAIIKDYERSHPDLIKPIYHEKNVGASRNAYEFTLPLCKGKYIACLEGDDYWTSPNKLQKQVDFLEANSDYSASGHQAVVFYDNGSLKPHKFGSNQDQTYTIENMISHRKFHTSSLMFRAEIIEKCGGIPTNIVSCDRAIFAMLSIYGKIMYFKDAMCVYRKSNIGISTHLSSSDLQKDLNMLQWIKRLDTNFPLQRLKSFIHFCIYSYPTKIKYSHLFKHYFLFIFFSFSYFPKNLGDVKWGTLFLFKKISYRFRNHLHN